MARTKPKDRVRKRTLTDPELRAIWQATEGSAAPFHRMVRFILLTGARRSEAAEMQRGEIEHGDWTLPASRNKTKLDLLRPLSDAAMAVLPAAPNKNDSSAPVFTTDGINPISGFSKFKKALDKASGTSGWTLHDLRRTARTLMSRAKADPDHAEMCLGHVIGGIRENYDCWEYHEEKAQVYDKLARLDRRHRQPAC